MELRRAGPAQAPAIAALTRRAYAKWVPLIGRDPWPMTIDYAEAVKRHRIDLLWDDGKLAALIELAPKPDHLLIENLAVEPAFQSQGLGRRLMAHAEFIASSSGIGEVRLYTNKLFLENVQLYERLGYCIGREEALSDGVAIHMSKTIGLRVET